MLRKILPYGEFQRQYVFWEMHPWGDDWKQTAKLCSILYASKGISIPEEEIIPIRRRERMSPKDLGRKLWVGFKALAANLNHRNRRKNNGPGQLVK